MEDNSVQPEVPREFQETPVPDSSISHADYIPLPAPNALELASATTEILDSDCIDVSETLSEPIIISVATTGNLSTNGETASLSFSENSTRESTCLSESTEKSTEQRALAIEVDEVQAEVPQEFQEISLLDSATSCDQCFPHRDPDPLEPTSEIIEILDLGDIDVSDIPNDPISNSVTIIGDASTSRETPSHSLSQNSTNERTHPPESTGKSAKQRRKRNRKKKGNYTLSAVLEKSGNLPCLPEEESTADCTQDEAANQQNEIDKEAAAKEGVMNVKALPAEQNLPDTQNENGASSAEPANQSDIGGVDGLDEKTKTELSGADYFSITSEVEKHSSLQTDTASNTECIGNKRKKRVCMEQVCQEILFWNQGPEITPWDMSVRMLTAPI